MATDTLDGALPRERTDSWKKTDIPLPIGEHKGYFVGMGDRYTDRFTDRCKACQGDGKIRDEECRACKGSGRETKERVPLVYQMGRDLFVEEYVSYVLSEPGKTATGGPKSASALYERMRSLSGLSNPAEISAWYKALPQPIRLPVRIMVVTAQDGKRKVIAQCVPIKADVRA